VGPRHSGEINGLSICGGAGSTVSLVVSEAVLNTYDDPEICEDDTESESDEKQQRGAGRPASRIISRI